MERESCSKPNEKSGIDASAATSRLEKVIQSEATLLIRRRHGADAILQVEIAAELDHTVLRRPGRDVDEVEWHRPLQLHVEPLARLLHRHHVLGLPALVR